MLQHSRLSEGREARTVTFRSDRKGAVALKSGNSCEVFPVDQTHTRMYSCLVSFKRWHCRKYSAPSHTYGRNADTHSHILACRHRQLYLRTPNHSMLICLLRTRAHTQRHTQRGNWTSCEFLLTLNDFNTVLILLSNWSGLDYEAPRKTVRNLTPGLSPPSCWTLSFTSPIPVIFLSLLQLNLCDF